MNSFIRCKIQQLLITWKLLKGVLSTTKFNDSLKIKIKVNVLFIQLVNR